MYLTNDLQWHTTQSQDVVESGGQWRSDFLIGSSVLKIVLKPINRIYSYAY